MSQSECVVCDYVIDLPEPAYETGLTGVQVPTALYLEQIKHAEDEMIVHLSEHTTQDFVEALHKADAYIAELEEELRLAHEVMTTPVAVGLVDKGIRADRPSMPALEIPPEWQQGLQAPVTVRDEPRRVPPTPENPHGLAYPNGRPSLRAPGRSSA